MKISTFKYFFRDCFRSIRKNALMSVASVISVLAALVILGIFLLLLFNVQHLTNEMEEQLELKVFLEEDIAQEQKDAIEAYLKSDPDVESYEFQDKDEALENMSNQLEGYENILSGLEDDNPLPEAFIVKAERADKIYSLNDKLEGLDGVDYINYGANYIDSLINFNRFANTLSVVVLIILTGISLFIIFNTIKITLFARRKEIGIMKLVGATNWYIRVPFVIEGSLLGLMGAILAIFTVRNAYYYLVGLIKGQSVLMMGISFAPADAVMPQITMYFLVYGLIVGALGSLFSIRKFLDI